MRVCGSAGPPRSVIVNDFCLVGVTITPDETEARFAGDADRVLAVAIPLQGFKLVTGRKAQGRQLGGRCQHAQLAQRGILKVGEFP